VAAIVAAVICFAILGGVALSVWVAGPVLGWL